MASLLKSFSRLDNQNRRNNHVDRGSGQSFLDRCDESACRAGLLTSVLLGTYKDGYTTEEELAQLANFFARRNNIEGLRDGLTMLLQHYMMLRSDNVLRLEFADLSSQLMPPTEGPTRPTLLVFQTRQGKTNQLGRLLYTAFTRAKREDICAVGCLALYFFVRCASPGNLRSLRTHASR